MGGGGEKTRKPDDWRTRKLDPGCAVAEQYLPSLILESSGSIDIRKSEIENC